MSPVEAAALAGVELVGPLAGGEVGAYEVACGGERGVMKWFAGGADRAAAERALPLVEQLRARGYPAPGVRQRTEAAEALVTVQEWMPGHVKEHVGHALVDDVLALNALQGDIVHGDFHHRNLLVADGRVSAVVDWDDADVGDPAFDLVTLAFCSVVATCEPGAVERLWQAALERRGREAVSGYVHDMAARQVDWSRRHRTPADVIFWRDAGERALSLL
jgi:thiamine kinase-like enzyme